MHKNLTRRRRLAVGTALAVLVTVSGPTPSAEADAALWNYLPSCRTYSANINNSAGSYTYETSTHVTPTSSVCNDINSISHPCMNHRIRFYPSGGGSWANGWQFDCDGAFIVASSVSNGTTYRNEGGAFGYFHIED